MKALKLFFIGFLLIVIPFCLTAQDEPPPAPIPVEALLGNNRIYVQTIITRRFTPVGRFGYFSVANFAASYDNDSSAIELAVPFQLSCSLWKGFGIMTGVSMNARAGFHPIAGSQYVYAGKKILVVVVPGFYLTPDHNFELFSMLEFKPPLNDKLVLYTRAQVLYNQNTETDFHQRSYFYLRAGLKIKNAGFGLGANLDRYGPSKTLKENYGVFVRWEFR